MADIWILIADRARARLFSLSKGASRMLEIADFVSPEARTPGHELERAPPPRVHDRLGDARHTIEAHTSPREKAAFQFAGILAAYLKRARDQQRYRDLVLIAPPRFLGALNAALGARLSETVLLRISKNLTRSPAAAIRAVLPRTLFQHHSVATSP